MRAALALLGALGAGAAGAESLPAFYHVTGVAADDVLNLRATPDPGGALVASLPPDAAQVEVIDFTDDRAWAQINYSERPVWAAARYLARDSGPEWWARPLTCGGVEPFWSLASAPEGALTLHQMGEPAEQFTVLWANAPQGGYAGALGWRFVHEGADGFATVTAQSCTDGMSERVEGLAITLFRETRDGVTGLTGCCRLAP